MLEHAYNNHYIDVCSSPIFVVGAPRSGTTGLGWALAEHTQMWTSAESLFLVAMFDDALQQYARWYDRPSATWLRLQDVDRREFLGHLGLGVNALFSSRSRGLRWIDHTPSHVFLVETLVEMFPGAKFLHLVRDGRAVVSSMINVSSTLKEEEHARMIEGEFLPRWAFDFGAASTAWQMSVDAGVTAAASHPDDVLTVMYDQLIRDPLQAFGQIFDFLAAPFEQAVVDRWCGKPINSSFAGRPAAAGGAEEWQGWTSEQRSLFRAKAGTTMARLGLMTEEEVNGVGADEVIAQPLASSPIQPLGPAEVR